MLVGSSVRISHLNWSRLSGDSGVSMGCSMLGVRQSNACFRFYSGHPRPTYVNLKTSETPSYVSIDGHQGSCFGSCISKYRHRSVRIGCSSADALASQKRRFILSVPCGRMNRELLSLKDFPSEVKCSVRRTRWSQGRKYAGLGLGLLICYSCFDPAYAESSTSKKRKGEDELCPSLSSHGKRVYTDYTITGIPGDGRCLFRSVAHGACIRAGQPPPSESRQRELADELRELVADEFIKRREETEWFVEGDFDTYVAQIRKPHVWGGEPELLMASHVLRMPITVYMHDRDAGGLISIAEYGREYDNEDPIQVIYHGFGHYDALQIPGTKRYGHSRL
ncbi:hypothetical protein MLD38_031031 [Melastoma candidum]|uniref:Uncharacterized protein n=1 Tax=Melastoma candidum TaxID=119954 RepID=A0ACB9MRZ5_9MYRT|nr:hypothetical protein MLD38_031031 [Melastoma candidum]